MDERICSQTPITALNPTGRGNLCKLHQLYIIIFAVLNQITFMLQFLFTKQRCAIMIKLKIRYITVIQFIIPLKIQLCNVIGKSFIEIAKLVSFKSSVIRELIFVSYRLFDS